MVEEAKEKRWRCRGVRGATTVTENSTKAILAATRELLLAIVEANEIEIDDVASIFFTTTPDLNSNYPALAARQLGWTDTALLCAHEMDVEWGMPLCVRVLIHWNTTNSLSEVQHVYLHEARNLRTDKYPLPPVG